MAHFITTMNPLKPLLLKTFLMLVEIVKTTSSKLNKGSVFCIWMAAVWYSRSISRYRPLSQNKFTDINTDTAGNINKAQYGVIYLLMRHGYQQVKSVLNYKSKPAL